MTTPLQAAVPVEVLLNEFLTDIQARHVLPATAHTYQLDIQEYLTWLNACGIAPVHVNEESLKRYHQYLNEHYAASTAHRKWCTVRRFYSSLNARQRISHNPVATFPVSRPSETRPSPHLLPADMRHLVEITNPDGTSDPRRTVKLLRDNLLLLLMMRQGLSIGETVQLDVGHVIWRADSSVQALQVRGRQSKPRVVPLVEQTAEVLQHWLPARAMMAAANEPALFISLHWGDAGHGAGGTRLTTRGVRSVVDHYLEAIGAKAPRVSSQALRCSYGIWSMFGGADPREVAADIGSKTAGQCRQVADHLRTRPADYLDFLEVAKPQDPDRHRR